MSDINEKVRTLEVLVRGNGSPGLLQRMTATESKTATQEGRIDRLEFITAQGVSKEGCIANQEKVRAVVEESIEKAFAQRKNSGLRMLLEWSGKIGPTLAGIAALLAILLD